MSLGGSANTNRSCAELCRQDGIRDKISNDSFDHFSTGPFSGKDHAANGYVCCCVRCECVNLVSVTVSSCQYCQFFQLSAACIESEFIEVTGGGGPDLATGTGGC